MLQMHARLWSTACSGSPATRFKRFSGDCKRDGFWQSRVCLPGPITVGMARIGLWEGACVIRLRKNVYVRFAHVQGLAVRDGCPCTGIQRTQQRPASVFALLLRYFLPASGMLQKSQRQTFNLQRAR